MLRDNGAARPGRTCGQSNAGQPSRLARKGFPHARSRQSSEGPQRSGGPAKRVDGRGRACVVNAIRAQRGPYPTASRSGFNPPTPVSGEPAVLAQLTPESKTEARLRLMHWTGMRPSWMERLKREDFHLDEEIPFVIVPQGKRGLSAMIPLVPEGLRAADAFLAADASATPSPPRCATRAPTSPTSRT